MVLIQTLVLAQISQSVSLDILQLKNSVLTMSQLLVGTINPQKAYWPSDLSVGLCSAQIRCLNALTCRTHWDTTPSGTSGNFWRRSCKTWMSIWWLPWAIRMLPGQDCSFCSAHCGVSQSWQQTAFILNIFYNSSREETGNIRWESYLHMIYIKTLNTEYPICLSSTLRSISHDKSVLCYSMKRGACPSGGEGANVVCYKSALQDTRQTFEVVHFILPFKTRFHSTSKWE